MSKLRYKGLWALWLVLLVPAIVWAGEKDGLDPYGRRIVAGEFLVKMRGDLILPQSAGGKLSVLSSTHKVAGTKLKQTYSTFPNLALVALDEDGSLESAIAAYKKSGLVERVSYNYIRTASVLPNDPLLGDGKQWGIDNAGQLGGIAESDVSAKEAWEIANDASEVLVAVLDSGIRYTHEDLAANMWVNSGEIAGNGLDDDNNGYVDDVHGINTVGVNGERTPETEGDPMDDLGHGTHVAGIVGAVGNNGVGITGVAWNVKLMGLKFLDSQGEGSDADAIECINYAREQGAHIINSSWGGLDFNPLLGDAIEEANEAGIYFVAAAGNESSNNDDQPNYPSSYAYPNVVSVTATDKRDGFATFANYGETEVELAAPGVGIHSTYFSSDTSYRALSGTSMATPFVSGAIALLLTQFPEEPMASILNRLFSSTDTLESLARRCRVGGRLNLARALQPETPAPLNDDFEDAFSVSNSYFILSGSNVIGSSEASEPFHDVNATGKSIWWNWTAVEGGFTEISTEGSDFNTVIVIYKGDSLDALKLVAKNRDESPNNNGAFVGFEASAGVSYRIAVDGLEGDSGNVSLSLGQSVINDDFSSALEIGGINFRTTSENIAASRESGEPEHIQNAFGSKSVWWKWTAPLSGNVTVSTSASNSFDTILAVYTGDSLEDLQLVSSNDDDDRTGVWTSVLNFYAQEGSEYKIAVDGWNGSYGQIALTVAMAEHDDREDARTAYTDTLDDISFTNQATKEIGEPSHGGDAVGQSLWWKWTSTRSGQAELTTFGSDFDTILAVYEGESLASLSLLGANDDSGGALSSRLALDVVAGGSYWVAVDGNDFRRDRSYGLARLNILVEEDASWVTPVIAEPEDPGFVAGEFVSFQIDANRNAISFAAEGLPAGLAIDPNTGAISGTPSQSGRFEVLIEATNAEGTGSYLYILEVAPLPGSPVIMPLPIEMKGIEGSLLTLKVDVVDQTGVTYQWLKDEVVLLGAVEASVEIGSIGSQDEGEYSVIVTNENGSVLAGTVRVRMIREALINIATRGYVGVQSEIMIAGFIISGSSPRRVLIRGLGKSLEQRGLSGVLEDPRLAIYDIEGQEVARVDDWKQEDNGEEIEQVSLSVGAAPLAEPNESAILVTLDPGLYTAHLSGQDGGTGIGLVEVFDASSESIETRLVNISTRVKAAAGDQVAIGGFVITGEDPKRVLIRALGPELTKRQVSDPMPDPYMVLYDSSGPVAANDDWESEFTFKMREAFTQVGASQLDEESKDAAMVRELQPGLYTVIVNDFNYTSGIVLIEIFELP